MSERKKLTIKAKCQGVIRLLKIPKDVSYDAFYELLKSSFGVLNFQLQYSDEEGDSVQLGSQDELQEALKVGENLSTLKINIITQEKPTMSAMINEPNDCSNTTQRPSTVDNSEDGTAATNQGPNALVEPLSSLTINAKPMPKPRSNRRRIGFYTSLCSDIPDSEKGEDSQHGKARKKLKKEKTGSKYYASLAEDIAAMKLGQADESQKERREMKRRNLSRNNETPAHEVAKKENIHKGVKDKDVLHSDEEPPKWFEKVVDRMGQSLSSQVLGAIAAGTTNPATKKELTTPVHDSITCDGCQQTIVGVRYKCGNCPNFDLCAECEEIEGIHDQLHVFVKLRYPCIGVGRRNGVMIPILKDLIYKSKDSELAEEQDKRMKEVRKKLKQAAKKKREEQVGKKKADKKIKKLQKLGSSNSNDNFACGGYGLRFIGDGSYPDGTEVTPGLEKSLQDTAIRGFEMTSHTNQYFKKKIKFTKCWKVRNTGTVAWNEETKFMYLYGGLRCMLSTSVELPHLEPGHEGTVMATFIAPPDTGDYISVWCASYRGKNFGSKMWCKIKVVCEQVPSDNDEIFVDANETASAPMQESTRTSVDKPDAEKMNQDSSDPVFHAYITQQSQGDEISSAVVDNSENQATSSDDVSLLECNELEWDTCVLDDTTLIVHEDDEDYIDVISNASSDDFEVVPLPACFNPDIPLDIHDFEPLVVASVPLAQEPDVLLGSPANQQRSSSGRQSPTGEFQEQPKEESVPTAEPEQDETMDPEDDDVRYIPIISDRPATTEDSGDLPEQTTSVPIHIVRNREMSDQHPLTMPGFDARSTISEPIAPQTASLERTPLIHGRLPSSPPGRAVPVFQIQNAESGTGRTDSTSRSYEVKVATEGQGEWQAVRTQPPDVARQISEEEETVTIQPRGASPQGTVQSFASTLVTGTLKRVTDTVTWMTGKDTPSTVTYSPPSASDGNGHVVLPEIAEPVAESQGNTRVLMEQLHEMGFCDRQLNERLLRKHNMDVNKVVTEILHINDNDWSVARH